MSEQVQCNCEWNPDSHAKTCPVYLQQMVDALHAEAEELRAENAALRADYDNAMIAHVGGMV